MAILSCFPYQPPSMWPVQLGYNTESKLWLKHVMHPQTECRTGSINTSRYYFDLCAVHFVLNSPLCLRVMTIMLQETYVHRKMVDGQYDNYLGGCVLPHGRVES